jgi:Domain of unknown function (DUF151)
MRGSGRLGALVLIVAALVSAANARERAESPALPSAQEVTVVKVMQDARTQQPVIVLEGKRDKRQLVIAIGLAEATSIAVPLQGVATARPLTHDLFLTLFGRLQVSLSRVVITDLQCNSTRGRQMPSRSPCGPRSQSSWRPAFSTRASSWRPPHGGSKSEPA